MRTTDQSDPPPQLGEVKRPEPPKEPDPVRVADGIWRGADGKMYTTIPPGPTR